MHRVYKLVNKSEVLLIHDKSDLAIKKWINLWCNNDEMGYNLKVTSAGEIQEAEVDDEQGWLVGNVNNSFLLGLHWSEKFPELVYDSFVNIKTAFNQKIGINTVISHKLVNRAITSLLDMIVSEFNSEKNLIGISDETSDEFAKELNQPGSGYALITLQFNDDTYINIALDIKKLMQSKDTNVDTEPLYPAINAFGNSKITVKAIIGTSEIDINELTNLSVGDVISVDKKLSDKIGLFIDGKKVCQGFLGKQDGKISIKIENQ